MAELLVYTRNKTHADPVIDRRGCYKRGDVVLVRPDGWAWGARESKQAWIAAGNSAASWDEPFVIVRIPGVAVSRVERATLEQREDDTGADFGGTFRRRAWGLLVDTIPLAIRNQLAANGEVTVTATQVRNYFQRKRDAALLAEL